MSSGSYVANGDINPSRFVKLLTADDCVTMCGANDPIFGISQEFTRYPPIDGASALAASAGLPLQVYKSGSDNNQGVLLEIGSGGCTVGDFLESDASGKGVTIAGTGASKRNIGAKALETRSAGEFARVEPLQIVISNP